MISPENLSIKDLKGFHKAVREKIEAAIDNKVKAEGSIVLGMIDDELLTRGYDVSKLFKGYTLNYRAEIKYTK